MIINADSVRIPLADGSVHMAVTSPPYWGLRSYLPADDPLKPFELGAEPVHDCLGWATGQPCGECYVCHMVAVFREVRRVLRDDGTLWLNLGDSYQSSNAPQVQQTKDAVLASTKRIGMERRPPRVDSLKPKDLVGIPWRVALALQADGWWLRSDIVWSKPNPMPESVTDRPTKAHEYLFLLSKSERYFYDHEAAKEAVTGNAHAGRSDGNLSPRYGADDMDGFNQRAGTWKQTYLPPTRNRRTVWTIATRPYSGAHFATFPPDLVAPCVLAGTSQRGVCPVCGAPWERVVKKTGEMIQQHWAPGTQEKIDLAQGQHGSTSVMNTGYVAAKQTIGWRPTCECGRCVPDVPSIDGQCYWEPYDPIPAKVLDPFCGSGTVGEVCRDTGRMFYGLDLNPAYLRDLALPRAERKQAAAVLETLPLFTMND